MEYKERPDYGNGYRKTYIEGLETLLAARRAQCAQNRRQFIASVAEEREEYRRQYLDMLGWPLNEPPHPVLDVIENKMFENAEMIITRMQFEVFPGVKFYGILFRLKSDRPLPLVISQHGGAGTPELCSSFYDSANYNDMTDRILKQGVHVFAPQLSLWHADNGIPTHRQDFDNSFKQVGGSIAAVEIYCLQRCLDYFDGCSFTNGRYGMVGLSYGGFYTLYTAAADPRILAALSCSHFNDREKYNWADKCFKNASNTFLDAQVGALVCPRYLRIEVGDNDELFDVQGAIDEYKQLKAYYAEAPEQLEFHVFKGVHEFCPHEDDTGIIKVVERLKGEF